MTAAYWLQGRTQEVLADLPREIANCIVTMVGGQESTRSTLHLAELFRLADRCGLLSNPEMATRRMMTVLAIRGIEP